MKYRATIIVILGTALLCVIAGLIWTWLFRPARLIKDNELEQMLPEMLVQATVVSVSETNNGGRKGTFEIEHVFKGNLDLVGKRFYVEVPRSPIRGFPPTLLKERQTGMYALGKHEGKFIIKWSGIHGVGIPAWQGVSARYEQIRAAAEAIKTIVNASSGSRLKLIKNYARSRTPEVSVCAINIIAGLNDERLMGYLRRMLSDKDLTIAGQVAIDEALSKSESGQLWQNSSRRKALLKKWVSGKLDEHNATVVRTRLDLIAQHPGKLDYETILSLVKVAMANKDIPVSTRRDFLSAIMLIYQRSKLGDECFDFLVELVRDNKHEEIRLASAYAIRNFVKLDDNRTAALEQVISGLQDNKLIEILTEAIAKQP